MWLTRDGIEVPGPNPNIHRERDNAGQAGSNDKSEREREKNDKAGNTDRSADQQSLQVKIKLLWFKSYTVMILICSYFYYFDAINKTYNRF